MTLMPKFETKGDPMEIHVIRLGLFSYNQVEKKYYYTSSDGKEWELIECGQYPCFIEVKDKKGPK